MTSATTYDHEHPDQSDLPVQRRRTGEADFSFLTEPKWIMSHLFAAGMIALFLVAMFWQIGRRADRIATNEIVAARADAPAVTLENAVAGRRPADVEFRRVADTGMWVDGDLVRVANRTEDGVAGEWVVGLFTAGDGADVLVNRGFVPLNTDRVAAPEDGVVSIEGWLRTSRLREGLAVEDTGEGTLFNRLDINAIGDRIGRSDLFPMWLQLDVTAPADGPNPVPLPEQTNGPHFSYAVQWAIFAILGIVVYALLMRRIATTVRD